MTQCRAPAVVAGPTFDRRGSRCGRCGSTSFDTKSLNDPTSRLSRNNPSSHKLCLRTSEEQHLARSSIVLGNLQGHFDDSLSRPPDAFNQRWLGPVMGSTGDDVSLVPTYDCSHAEVHFDVSTGLGTRL